MHKSLTFALLAALLTACAQPAPPPPSYPAVAPVPALPPPTPLAPTAEMPPEYQPPPAYHRHHCPAGSHWVASHWAHGMHVQGRCRTNPA